MSWLLRTPLVRRLFGRYRGSWKVIERVSMVAKRSVDVGSLANGKTDPDLGGGETIQEERAFIRAVVAGLADIEAGREISLADVKAKLGLG